LQSKLIAGEAVVKETVFQAARHYPTAAGFHHRTPAVEAQAVILLGRAVTADTILAEDRLHIAGEVDLALRKSKRSQTKARKGCGSGNSEHVHPPGGIPKRLVEYTAVGRISIDLRYWYQLRFARPWNQGPHGGRSVTMACGFAVLRVKERVSFAYLYHNYESPDTVRSLRKDTETWADLILAKNR
jgi:hypothetical protein